MDQSSLNISKKIKNQQGKVDYKKWARHQRDQIK